MGPDIRRKAVIPSSSRSRPHIPPALYTPLSIYPTLLTMYYPRHHGGSSYGLTLYHIEPPLYITTPTHHALLEHSEVYHQLYSLDVLDVLPPLLTMYYPRYPFAVYYLPPLLTMYFVDTPSLCITTRNVQIRVLGRREDRTLCSADGEA